MSAIEVNEAYPLCRRSRGSSEHSDIINLSLCEITEHLLSRYDVAIYVDGWSAPWPLFVAVNGELRAQCPTAPKVTPRVVYISHEGTVYTGDEVSP